MSAQAQPFPRRIPFVDHLGFELWQFAAGRSELRLSPKPEHMNSWGVAHGGVVMTLMDVAMAHAARSVIEADVGAPESGAPGMVTIEMKTSFMRPCEGVLRACGHLLHRTSSLAFVEAQVLNAQGQLCAQATGTFKYLGGRLGNRGQAAPAQGAATP